MLKTSLPPADLAAGWTPGTEQQLRRCVRATYRLALMTAGQPCLLWVSGRERPGVHALGTLAGSAEGGEDPAVPVRLTLLEEVVPRADLMADPRTRDAEVLRMPAGSNPSWLSHGQFAAVLERLPDDALGPWTP